MLNKRLFKHHQWSQIYAVQLEIQDLRIIEKRKANILKSNCKRFNIIKKNT